MEGVHRAATWILHLALGAAAAGLLGLGAGAPAAAACPAPAEAAGAAAAAPTVFVGTVRMASDGGRRAEVRAETIWRGADLPRVVEVQGSADRTYTVGTRYLFIETQTHPQFTEGPCSATRPLTPDLQALRPANARDVPGPGDPQAAPVDVGVLVLGAIGTALGLGLLLVAARRVRGRPGRSV